MRVLASRWLANSCFAIRFRLPLNYLNQQTHFSFEMVAR